MHKGDLGVRLESVRLCDNGFDTSPHHGRFSASGPCLLLRCETAEQRKRDLRVINQSELER